MLLFNTSSTCKKQGDGVRMSKKQSQTIFLLVGDFKREEREVVEATSSLQ